MFRKIRLFYLFFRQSHPGAPLNAVKTDTMDDKSLDNFAKQLASMKPAAASEDFSLRLEAALAQADEEMVLESKVIVHPFAQPVAQWATAAAALFVGLAMAVQSTRVAAPAEGPSVAEAEVEQTEEVLPVYQVIDGRLYPVNDDHAMQMVRFRGMEVVDGRAFRQFEADDITYLQPFQSKPGDHEASKD